MAAPNPPSPPEGVWAHPRPPPGVPNLRNHLAGSANGLPHVSPQPVLSGRRSEPGDGGNLGGSAPLHEDLHAHESLSSKAPVGQAPHSARERGAGQQQRQRIQGRRAQSVDSNSGTATASGGSPPRRVKRSGRSASTEGSDTFLRVLNDIVGSNLNEAHLARLDFEAGPSRRAQEVAKLLHVLRSQIHNETGTAHSAQPQEGGLDQMTAQVAFLEKKIMKLREKLKRKTLEATNRADSISRLQRKPQGSKLDLHNASHEELMAEVSALRIEKATMDSAEVVPSPRPRTPQRMSISIRHNITPEQDSEKQTKVALKRRLIGLQNRMKDLLSEKEAADANAEGARGLAEKVEEHLRETALTSESERIKLEADQELLRRRIEEQQNQILQLEGVVGSAGELQDLKEKIAEAEHELSTLRSTASPGGTQEVATGKPSTPQAPVKPATPKTGPSHEECERLVRSSQEAREECARLAAELNDAEATDADRIRQLEEDLTRVRKDGQRSEYQRRRQLADVMEQRLADFESETEHQYSTMPTGESEALVSAKRNLEDSRAKFQEAIEAERTKVTTNLKHMEAQMMFGQSEIIHTLDRQKMQAHRHCDLRGRCYVALRPQKYQRDEVLQYLGFAMGLPISCIEVLEEVCVPEGTTFRKLVQATGKPVPPPRDKMDIYVRPLRENTRPPPQDADEEARRDTREEARHASGSGRSRGPGQNQHRAMGGGSGEEEPPEGSLIRLTINFSQDMEATPAASDMTGGRAALVHRLSMLVASGGTLLEDMAVVSVSSLIGSTPLDDADSVPGELVGRLKRSIAGRSFLITARRTLQPLSVKLIAIDHVGGEEFILYFDDRDLQTLLGAHSALLHQSAFGRELFEALLDTLHVITIADGKTVLVSIHAVPAPRTVLNAQPECLQDAQPFPSATTAAPAHSDASKGGESLKKADDEPGGASSDQSGSVAFEDVFMIEDRFFVLTIHQQDVTGNIDVRIQEAGLCQVFTATLPGRDLGEYEDEWISSRQLRVFAQSYDFDNLSLLLSVEDIAVPPGVVVRVARADPVHQHAQHDSDQRVYWLSQACADDGRLGVGVQIDGPETIVSEVPSRHREQLLDFVRGKREWMRVAATKKDTQEPTDDMHTKPLGKALTPWVPEYGTESDREGIVLFDASSYKPLRTAAATIVGAHLKDASDKAGGRPLLKTGRRIPGPGGTSTLCVLTIREHSEPHVHFTVGAYEIGKCRFWTMLVDSLDIFRALQMRVSTSGQNAMAKRALAREIVNNSKLVSDEGGGLQLTLAAPSQSSRAITTSTDLDQAPHTAHVDAHVLAPQALSQEDAARYMADPRHFCLLRASRTLGGLPFDVRIYDEPDAPDAAFLINNLLVIAIDTTRGVVFTHRLNDKSMQHPLLPEEQYLLEPENRAALLKRIAESIDLCTSVGQHGSVGDRLVMQSFQIDTLPPLVPDGEGTLIPSMISGPSEDGPLSAQDEGRSSTGEHGEDPTADAPADRAISTERPDVSERVPSNDVTAGSPTVLYIGGVALDEKDIVAAETSSSSVVLASERSTLGDVDVELALRTDHEGSAHIFSFKTVGEVGAHPGTGFEVQIPAGGDPTRAYLEYRVFEGTQLIVSIRQQAFPHEVQAIVFDIKSHEQLTLVARDDAILPLIERSARERLSDLVEQLVKSGSLGVTGSPELYKSAPSGREIFPSDFDTRALQRHTPVVSTNFDQRAHEVPSELVRSRDLLYSGSRYVISPDLIGNAVTQDGVDLTNVDLDSVPLLRLSLSKKTYCQEFTFSIENARDGSGGQSHMLHIRDKLAARPLGVYAEIQKLGDMRLHILFMDDFLPRSLRIAVVEPVSGWSFQLIILDASTTSSPSKAGHAQDPHPFLTASPARHALLDLFRKHLSVRRGLPAVPMLTNQQVPTELMRPSADQPQSTPTAAGPAAQTVPKSLVLLRQTGDSPNGKVVLFTISRELEANGTSFFLKATLSQAAAAKETSVLLLTNSLDQVLHACNLPPSAELTAEDFDKSPEKQDVAEKFLAATEVSPNLEISLSLDKLPRQPPPTESEAVGTNELALADHDLQGASGPPLLECNGELLGRIDRLWAPVEQFWADGGGAEPPSPEGADSGDQPEATLRVEVFDGSDCVEALFHSTNLRLRVTDLAIGRVATRDIHEEDLEPWLAEAHATHLLSASRESDLIDMVLRHTSLAESGKSPTARGVVLEKLSPGMLTDSRYATSFLESTERKPPAG